MTTPKTIIVLGKTGSGKGTQAENVADKLGYKTFSTGGRFRELMKEESPLGRRVKELHENGILFPYWFPAYLLQEFLFGIDQDTGVVTEGSGRSVEEAKVIHEVMDWLGRDYVVVELQVSDDSVIERQIKRGRTDSNTKEKLQTRLDEYSNKTAPAIEFFKERGKLVEVDGEPAIDQVFENVCSALNIS